MVVSNIAEHAGYRLMRIGDISDIDVTDVDLDSSFGVTFPSGTDVSSNDGYYEPLLATTRSWSPPQPRGMPAPSPITIPSPILPTLPLPAEPAGKYVPPYRRDAQTQGTTGRCVLDAPPMFYHVFTEMATPGVFSVEFRERQERLKGEDLASVDGSGADASA